MVRDARGGRSGVPTWVEPILAKPDGGRLPSGPNMAHEYKLDGHRWSMRIEFAGTVGAARHAVVHD
jgi:bifunctional non-homologous end joining protein LigD